MSLPGLLVRPASCNKPLETATIRTVAAFLNSRDGGTLLHAVDGNDLCRVHVRPSAFPVEAKVVVDRKGQFERKTAFYVRLANGTREIVDPVERAIGTSPVVGPRRRPKASYPHPRAGA